jgi:hypothetical protein
VDAPRLSTEDGALLRELRAVWHDRYRITVDQYGAWHAERLTGEQKFTAKDGQSLRPLITEDAIRWNHETWGRD